ncbi:amidophosphoribosyltransferase [Thermodesulfovibrionales bacterium]|nr:amidophosphoribosyltransferase [Thermodesulfovibrionales bacterium]
MSRLMEKESRSDKSLPFHHLYEECGIFGVYNHPEAANLTYLGLYALQHRGQEGAGICSSDGKFLYLEKSVGLVSDIFTERRIRRLPGVIAIGHNRYSTSGWSTLKNVQPLMGSYAHGIVAMAHNGNIVNAGQLRENLKAEGAIFQSTLDSEVILHLIARSKKEGLYERIIDIIEHVSGAYGLLFLSETELISLRDPFGVRPLSIGRLDGAYVISSETCAFDLIGAEYIRDVEPGEMVVINNKGLQSTQALQSPRRAFCIFEFIYFARPDSFIFGHLCVDTIRKQIGRQLARESWIDVDVVIPVPDSGVSAAIGYAEEAKIPFNLGLIRNHYIGRTFIEPSQSIRDFGVKIKMNPVRDILKGKKVVVVDDSLIRGTTSKKIIKMIREIGEAKEVHMRICSPPTVGPCFYGINTPTRRELIASSHMTEEVRRHITADSLSYLSLEGLKEVVQHPENYCMACFDNKYPIVSPVDGVERIHQMELMFECI